ncbi:MAG: hypothetical protein Q9166_007351 [cf. Caloplaca sp. 2 TL-2023]
MSVTRAPDPALTATGLISPDERQLVQYLERNADGDGGFDISGLVDVKKLSKSQRKELGGRLRAAASHLETSQPLNTNELFTRLTSVAHEQDGSQSPDPGLLRPPAESFESRITPPPINPKDHEAARYHELIKDGGRPVCSIQDLSHFRATPTASYEMILPWLSDHPDSEIGDGEVKTVFSRQFARWWDFRKWQLDNRGIGDSEEGFSAFLEAERSVGKRMGAHAMVSASSFEETERRLWQHKPTYRQLPDGQAFPAYSEAVKRRLTPHHFTRPLQLKKNPRQQTKWTNWLEYLSYEQWWLEKLTAVAEPLEEQYHQALRRLLEAPRYPLGEVMGSNSINAASSSAAIGSTQTRQRRPGPKTVDLANELDAARAALDATNKTINDFIRETAPYRYAQTDAYYQRHRVEWVIKEARLMETEMSQQSKTAKSNTKVDIKENKKRRRGDDEEITPEPRSKRAKRGDGGKSAVSDTTPGKPGARRSKRLAQGKPPLQAGV